MQPPYDLADRCAAPGGYKLESSVLPHGCHLIGIYWHPVCMHYVPNLMVEYAEPTPHNLHLCVKVVFKISNNAVNSYTGYKSYLEKL